CLFRNGVSHGIQRLSDLVVEKFAMIAVCYSFKTLSSGGSISIYKCCLVVRRIGAFLYSFAFIAFSGLLILLEFVGECLASAIIPVFNPQAGRSFCKTDNERIFIVRDSPKQDKAFIRAISKDMIEYGRT